MDFIEVYPDALSPDTCAAILEYYHRSGQAVRGATGSGVNLALKDSYDVMISRKPDWQTHELALNGAVFNCLKQYARKYCYSLIAPVALQIKDPVTGAMRMIDRDAFDTMDEDRLTQLLMTVFRPGDINVQRYLADQGGYPYWHCEFYPKDPSCETLHRALLWTVYLNDGFAEGETEFFYQDRKIQPRIGSLLIAPTAFTHTHRGNRPKGGDKYIATSWILFNRAEKLYGG